MSRLRAFLALSPQERWLLVSAAFLIIALRLPHRKNSITNRQRRAAQLAELLCLPTRTVPKPSRIGWAVETVGQYVPSTCLYDALAAQALLEQYSCEATFHLGVLHDGGDEFAAHAWVTSEAEVLVGDCANLSEYQEFPESEL